MIDVLIWLVILAITGGTIKWMVGDDSSQDNGRDYPYYHSPVRYATGYEDQEDLEVPDLNERLRESVVSTGIDRRYYRFNRRTGRLEYSDEE